MTYSDLKDKADELRKARDYTDALSIYEKIWTQHSDKADEWIGWGYGYCLRKAGRVDEALEICRDTWRMNPNFEINNSLYGWCIYDTNIKNSDKDITMTLKAAKAIVNLTEQGQYSPYERVVFAVVDTLKEQNVTRWEQVLEWIDKLDPDQLSQDENAFTASSGRQVVTASPLEKYYAYKTKALEELDRYTECLRVSEEALRRLSTFHHDNDIWFARRAALSKGALGQVDDAIRDLKKLVLRKPDWFLHYEIAYFQLQKGDIEAALVSAATAALAPGPLFFKGELFKLLADIMQKIGESEIAQQHLQLVSTIRTEQGWKADAEVEDRLNADSEDSHDTAKQIMRSLQPVWKEAVFTGQKEYEGTVKTILPHGGAGFIMDETGTDHYFDMRDVKANSDNIEQGTRVCFHIADSYDKKKQEKSTKAVHVRVISD